MDDMNSYDRQYLMNRPDFWQQNWFLENHAEYVVQQNIPTRLSKKWNMWISPLKILRK